jgi:hypothetical protein
MVKPTNNGFATPGRNGRYQPEPDEWDIPGPEDGGFSQTRSLHSFPIPGKTAPEGVCEDCEGCETANPVSAVKSAPQAVEDSLPAAKVLGDEGLRRAVFNLAKNLKAADGMAGATADEALPWAEAWFSQCADRLNGATFTEVEIAFLDVWDDIGGRDVIREAWEEAVSSPPPPEAAGKDDPRWGRLINFCRILQGRNVAAGRGQWFCLSGYTLAPLLGLSQPAASSWLRVLVKRHILEVVNEGGGFLPDGRRRAREYRVVKQP